MQVQRVNSVSFYNNSVRKISKPKAPSFNGYIDVMSKVVKRDLKDVSDVSNAFGDLYSALKSSPEVKVSPDLSLLEKNGLLSINSFMKKICAPIAKVPSELRDLVFKSEEESIELLKDEYLGSLSMCNFGKKGFFNNLFNSQDAKSDIKFLFSTPVNDSFEVGITGNGGLQVEQVNYPNWIKSEFDFISRSSQKFGTIDYTPPLWATF